MKIHLLYWFNFFIIWFVIFHRLETTKLLLDSGADPFARSKNDDDALQIACLKGAHDIFRHLIERIPYSKERLANANELIGMIVVQLISRLICFY